MFHMRLKLTISLLAGAVAFSIAGFAIASPGKSIIDSGVNALSTIGNLVSTSLWNTHESAHATHSEPVATNAKHISIIPPSGQVSLNLSSTQSERHYTDLPGINLPLPNITPSVEGYTGKNDFVIGDSRNTFVGELGDVPHWGSLPGAPSGGVPNNYIPGTEIGPGISKIDQTPISASPTPEPGEWILMLLGLGLVGYVTKLRKQKTGLSINL